MNKKQVCVRLSAHQCLPLPRLSPLPYTAPPICLFHTSTCCDPCWDHKYDKCLVVTVGTRVSDVRGLPWWTDLEVRDKSWDKGCWHADFWECLQTCERGFTPKG